MLRTFYVRFRYLYHGYGTTNQVYPFKCEQTNDCKGIVLFLIETRLTKAWTAINRLSIIWKSDLTNKMKRSFFQAAVTSILLYGCTTWTLTKRLREEARRQLHKNAACNIEQVLAATPHKTPTVRPPAPLSRKLFKLDETRHAGH